MPRSYLVLDIETVPDTELYRAPEVAPGPGGQVTERPFPPLFAHRPIVLGCMWLDERYKLKKLGVIGEDRKGGGRNLGGNVDDEKAMLENFSDFVEKHRPELVTYNGRSFDLPVIALRALRHGVPMPWYYQGRLRHRYSEDGHLDLCDMLSDHGAARSVSLDAMARLIGLPGKVGVDGSQVEGMYRAGQLELIRSYCLSDVAQTALLFLRFRLIQGLIPPEIYRERMTELVDQLRDTGRVTDLMNAIDGERLVSAAA